MRGNSLITLSSSGRKSLYRTVELLAYERLLERTRPSEWMRSPWNQPEDFYRLTIHTEHCIEVQQEVRGVFIRVRGPRKSGLSDMILCFFLMEEFR